MQVYSINHYDKVIKMMEDFISENNFYRPPYYFMNYSHIDKAFIRENLFNYSLKFFCTDNLIGIRMPVKPSNFCFAQIDFIGNIASDTLAEDLIEVCKFLNNNYSNINSLRLEILKEDVEKYNLLIKKMNITNALVLENELIKNKSIIRYTYYFNQI